MSQNSKNQGIPYYFCLMEGSGSVQIMMDPNMEGLKNIRIRMHYTDAYRAWRKDLRTFKIQNSTARKSKCGVLSSYPAYGAKLDFLSFENLLNPNFTFNIVLENRLCTLSDFQFCR
jgi:hypothetical protein